MEYDIAALVIIIVFDVLAVELADERFPHGCSHIGR